jgi:hypothetical protein
VLFKLHLHPSRLHPSCTPPSALTATGQALPLGSVSCLLSAHLGSLLTWLLCGTWSSDCPLLPGPVTPRAWHTEGTQEVTGSSANPSLSSLWLLVGCPGQLTASTRHRLPCVPSRHALSLRPDQAKHRQGSQASLRAQRRQVPCPVC